VIHTYVANNFSIQIEDLSQQAQVAAAEKFKEPPVAPPAEAGGSTTVRYNIPGKEMAILCTLSIQLWKISESHIMHLCALSISIFVSRNVIVNDDFPNSFAYIFR